MISARVLTPRRPGIVPAIRFKHAIAVVVLGLGLLTILIATHTSTYSLSLSRMSSQQDVQQPVQAAPAKQQPTVLVPTYATPASAMAVTHQLTRIGQEDAGQYGSSDEYATWAASACSTTSMTEVLNAWWGYARYKITDVLKQELAANAISSTQGLKDSDGIARTMRRFGFDTTTPSLSLDQVIDQANNGIPVIVGWPPAKWSGGHLLVVVGGDQSLVKLADSSHFNYTALTRATFLARWGGFAVISKPDAYGVLAVTGPTLTAATINSILTRYHSPMQGQGAQILTTLAPYHVDPALALAFYLHESTMGTKGMSAITNSWGNSRCLSNYGCVNQSGDVCQPQQSCYAKFDTRIDGLKEWCWQITNDLYAAGGKDLVDDIIPTYAPSADNNDEGAYIAALKHAADTWRSGALLVQ